ncbi:MAG: nucleotide exchange factor GrpE, partial [Methylococcales bacterium]
MNRDQDVSEGEEPIVSQDENIESEVDVEDSDAEKEANEVEQEPQLSVEELTQQLVVAKEEAAGNWDKALRIQAEMENVKRRSQKDIESAHKFALVGFAKELLTVVDSL